MASTFLKAHGLPVGDSLVEDDQLEAANDILAYADIRGVPLLLPIDVVIADEFKADADHDTVSVNAIPDGWRVMDIGPDSLEAFSEALKDCKTVFWNGPLGVAEFPAFAEGSLALAMELADLDAKWSSAAARRRRWWSSRAWASGSRTSRPVVARRWSLSRARRCQELRR